MPARKLLAMNQGKTQSDASRLTPTLPMDLFSTHIVGIGVVLFATAWVIWWGVLRDNEPTIDLSAPGQELLAIDINHATASEFNLLPSVGPVLAERIVADRKQNGAFVTVNDLSRVPGIGPKTLDQIGDYCVPAQKPGTRVAFSSED